MEYLNESPLANVINPTTSDTTCACVAELGLVYSWLQDANRNTVIKTNVFIIFFISSVDFSVRMKR